MVRDGVGVGMEGGMGGGVGCGSGVGRCDSSGRGVGSTGQVATVPGSGRRRLGRFRTVCRGRGTGVGGRHVPENT